MTTIPRRSKFFLTFVFMVLALAAGLFVHDAARDRGGASDIASPAQPAASSPGSTGAGMVVAIDPETGALTAPTPEQRRELGAADAAKPSRSTTETYQLPDGTVIGRIDESSDHYSVLQVGADGKVQTVCAHGEKKCNSAVPGHTGHTKPSDAGPTAPPAAPPEK